MNALLAKIRGKKFAVHGSSKMEVSFLVKRPEFALLTAVLFTKIKIISLSEIYR